MSRCCEWAAWLPGPAVGLAGGRDPDLPVIDELALPGAAGRTGDVGAALQMDGDLDVREGGEGEVGGVVPVVEDAERAPEGWRAHQQRRVGIDALVGGDLVGSG